MKRILFLLITGLVVVLSCQKEPVDLLASVSSLSFDADNTTEKITVSSNYPWTMESQVNWLSLNLYKGDAGEYAVEVTCLANSSFIDRETDLILSSEDAVLRIKVYQDGRILKAQGLENNLELDHTAQDFSIDVMSTANYTASASAGWIHVLGTKASRITTSVFHADRNTSPQPRTAKIVFKSGSSVTCVVEVTQSGGPVMDIFSNDFSFDSFGGSAVLFITCSDVPTATYPEGVTWLSFGGSPEDGFILTAEENTGFESREADVFLHLMDLSDTLHVTQAGAAKDPYVEIPGQTEASVSSDGGILAIDIYSNTSIEITGHSDWAEVESLERDGSRYTLTVQVSPYELPDDAYIAFDNRIWEIGITDRNHQISKTFTIVQTPADYETLKLAMPVPVKRNLAIELFGDSPSGCVKVGSNKTKVEDNKASVPLEPGKDVTAEICSRGADAVKFQAVDNMKIIISDQGLIL